MSGIGASTLMLRPLKRRSQATGLITALASIRRSSQVSYCSSPAMCGFRYIRSKTASLVSRCFTMCMLISTCDTWRDMHISTHGRCDHNTHAFKSATISTTATVACRLKACTGMVALQTSYHIADSSPQSRSRLHQDNAFRALL